MKSSIYSIALLVVAAQLSACGPAQTNPVQPAAVVQVVTNEDGTRTFAHKINGLLEGRTLVYYPTGAIADIFYFHRDTSDGIQRRFYPNGQLMSWQQMHKGLAEGDYYDFLENGAISHIEHYANGARSGHNLWFYEQPRNHLRKLVEWLSVEGKAWQNSYAEYDTLGRVLVRQGFLRARAVHDTVSVGDSLEVRLQVPYPKYRLVAVVTGDFDASFRLHKPSSLRRSMGSNHIVTLYVPAQQRGRQIVRGYLVDFNETKSNTGKPMTDRGQRMYFAYPYFVR